jgi:hypothetical protein
MPIISINIFVNLTWQKSKILNYPGFSEEKNLNERNIVLFVDLLIILDSEDLTQSTVVPNFPWTASWWGH